MIVVSRFDVPGDEADSFLLEAEVVLDALAVRPGFVRGRVGRAADDPGTWLLSTEWDSVGAYRRSLSAYDVKVATAALFARARPEPSAFEVLASRDEAVPTVAPPSARAVVGEP